MYLRFSVGLPVLDADQVNLQIASDMIQSAGGANANF